MKRQRGRERGSQEEIREEEIKKRNLVQIILDGRAGQKYPKLGLNSANFRSQLRTFRFYLLRFITLQDFSGDTQITLPLKISKEIP
jgi:hypothetical protein